MLFLRSLNFKNLLLILSLLFVVYAVWFHLPNLKLRNTTFDRLYVYENPRILNKKVALTGRIIDIDDNKIYIKNAGLKIAEVDIDKISSIMDTSGKIYENNKLQVNMSVYVRISYKFFIPYYEFVI